MIQPYLYWRLLFNYKDFSNYNLAIFSQLFGLLTGSTLAYPAKDVLKELPSDITNKNKTEIFNDKLDSKRLNKFLFIIS